MITLKRYNLIKKNWGEISSWAVWDGPFDRSKANIDNLSIFDCKLILKTLNPEVILVGLNISRDDLKGKPVFSNFHSSYRHAQEYKLRYVLKGTPFWGGYLTDIIKDHPEIDSKNVMKALEKNPLIERKNIAEFKREIKDLGAKNPLIVALGGQVYDILSRNVKEFKVVQIPHFSARKNLDNYKKQVADSCKYFNFELKNTVQFKKELNIYSWNRFPKFWIDFRHLVSTFTNFLQRFCSRIFVFFKLF